MADLDIKQLCEATGVTPRTVHFYIQQGLLPPAASSGPSARYTDGHASRIRLIRLLQQQHLPLAEIAKRTKSLSDDQVEGLIAEAKQRRDQRRGSALDYVRSVLGDQKASSAEASPAAPSPVPGSASRSFSAQLSPAPFQGAPARSQWDRFALTDGIELHVRRPLSRIQQRQLDRLVNAAREIFEQEQS